MSSLKEIKKEIIKELEKNKEEIQERPWQTYPKTKKKYQCYCSELKERLLEIEPEDNRTKLSDGKVLRYQKLKPKFNTKSKLNFKFNGEDYSIKKFKLMDESLNGQFLKTFQTCYQKQIPLSFRSRNLLNSFTNKYIYYAIDDILYLLASTPIERDNLLTILYSSMLSLQNEFNINFFDIWIDSIYVNDDFKTNRFLSSHHDHFNKIQTTTIILKLHYFKRTPIKKPEPLW